MRGNRPRRTAPYPLGQIPKNVITEIGKQIVHRLAIGLGDITGDDFGTIFAKSIGGVHRPQPIGVADVEWNGCAWSVKTIKDKRPHSKRRARLISGRNSPSYSSNITDPHADPSATGVAVISIWNARMDEALAEHEELRVAVLVRNIETREFLLFEEEAQRFAPDDYEWSFNSQKNLEAHDKVSKIHKFTWQPHGSQFTIIRDVPGSARRFHINANVPLVEPDEILKHIHFNENWINLQT